MVHNMSPLKTPLKAPLAKGVFKEVFLRFPFPLQNQEWDPSTLEKYLFVVMPKDILKKFFKGAFKGVFKGDIFCTIIGTLILSKRKDLREVLFS